MNSAGSVLHYSLMEVEIMSNVKQNHSAKIETTDSEEKYKDIEDAIQKAIDSEKIKSDNSRVKQQKLANK